MKKPAAAAKCKGKPAAAKASAKKKVKVKQAEQAPDRIVIGASPKLHMEPQSISLCSDCSGLGTEFLAASLAFPRASIKHNYASDIDPACRPVSSPTLNPKP